MICLPTFYLLCTPVFTMLVRDLSVPATPHQSRHIYHFTAQGTNYPPQSNTEAALFPLYVSLSSWCVASDDHDPTRRQWQFNWLGPVQIRYQRPDAVRLGLADEDRQTAAGSYQSDGCRKDGLEAFDGAERDDICVDFGPGCLRVFRARFAEVVGGPGEYIDIGQCKTADNLAQKSGLLLSRLDQGEVDVRSPDLDGKAGESGARSNVDDMKP